MYIGAEICDQIRRDENRGAALARRTFPLTRLNAFPSNFNSTQHCRENCQLKRLNTMTQPILHIKAEENKSKAVANLLPCRVHHNGSIDPTSAYWTPSTAKGSFPVSPFLTQWLTKWLDGAKIAYFRGRKLQGKVIKLPEQCHGVVVERRDDKPVVRPDLEVAEDEELSDPVGTMRVTADFDELVVWGHEAVADAAEDPYVRSMEEWLQLSNKVSPVMETIAGPRG